MAALLLGGGAARAQDDAPRPFGVIEGFWLPEEACAIGAGWERIIFDWGQHQPDGPNSWNTLNVDDRWLEAARACDREVVAIVKNTPAWATDGTVGIGVPRGLALPVDDPANFWAAFMRRAAEYYAPRGVQRFIIWNEPDIPEGTYGYEFEGLVNDYAQLLRVAHLAARAANPNARIHIAGTTYWHDVNAGRRLYLDRLLEALRQFPDAHAHGHFFDAVTLHIYYRVETVYAIIRETRALLEAYGLADKHIWLGETNASPNLDPLWPVTRPNWQITLDQQAAYLVQAAALALAAGADHIGLYKFYDWNLSPGAEAFGVIRADGSRRPAFDAWRYVGEHFSAVQEARYSATNLVAAVRLTTPAAHYVVAWARTSQPALLETSGAGPAQLFDQYGNITPLAAQAGGATLALPGALCNPVEACPVGGAPVIVRFADANFQLRSPTPTGALLLPFK